MSDTLSVLVNLSWLVPGVVGGSEESSTDAVRALLDCRPDIRPTLAVLRGFVSAHPDLAEQCRCEVLDSSGGNKLARVAAEQTWLARRTKELRPDVVHHAGGVVPLRHPGRIVLTIHDLQPLDEPANFSLPKRIYMRGMLGRSARTAEVVCVPSEFTAARVVELLGVPRERIKVVPWSVLGPDQAVPSGGGDAVPSDGGDAVPSDGGDEGAVASAEQEGPVFLYPAITYPHKNHAVLLDAFAELLRSVPDARLVLAGGPGPCEQDVLERIVCDDLAGRVDRPGRVERPRMERLYREATAVLIPSRYEGFGLPALEAMSRGVPLIVADSGSLPEVVTVPDGFATPLGPVAPDDPHAWSVAMATVASMDDARRREVHSRETRAAAAFTPRRTADALADSYWTAASRATPL